MHSPPGALTKDMEGVLIMAVLLVFRSDTKFGKRIGISKRSANFFPSLLRSSRARSSLYCAARSTVVVIRIMDPHPPDRGRGRTGLPSPRNHRSCHPRLRCTPSPAIEVAGVVGIAGQVACGKALLPVRKQVQCKAIARSSMALLSLGLTPGPLAPGRSSARDERMWFMGCVSLVGGHYHE